MPAVWVIVFEVWGVMEETLTLGAIRRLHWSDRLLLYVSIGAAFFFLTTRQLEPYFGSVVIKALGVSPLAIFVLRNLTDRDGLLLATGLAFSVLGDVFLAIDPQNLFVFGLGAFLVGHLFYVALFARNFPFPMRVSRGKKMAVAGLGLYGVVMVAWLWPDMGDLRAPVAFYISVILAMGVCAVLAEFARRWIVIGALLFIFSDSVIAVEKFKLDFAASDYLIWATYYLGQYLIAMGFVRERLRSE